MTNTREVRLHDYKLKFIDGRPHIGPHAGDGDFFQLEEDDIANMAEFAAEAWLALTDEDYRPVVITEDGYVYDEGAITLGPKSVVAISDAVAISLAVPREVSVEVEQE